MSLKEQAARYSMKAVDAVGKRYYENQKELLDELRSEDYALIVLDALRYDYAQQILPLYFEGDIRPIWSEGHDTFQYGQACWSEGTYEDWYLSGAVPFNKSQDFEDEFLKSLYGAWKPPEYLPNLIEAFEDCWNRDLGTCDPEQLTGFAMDYLDKEKLVVHYFQPHAPYIGDFQILGHTNSSDAMPMQGDPIDKPLWEAFKSGEIPKDRLRLAYRANVHCVTESLLPLIEQLCTQDRRVVIMGDHGELLGRFDRKAVAHPRISFPQIRRIPWMEVTGIRDKSQKRTAMANPESDNVASRLEALGYR